MSIEIHPCIHLARGSEGCGLAVRLAAVAVVVDALRASTTIPALFERGAGRVLVVARVEDARALAETIPGVLLVGERQEERLPGFDLGNSPLEVLAAPRMDGRTVIFTSSNGAQRLTACRGVDRLFVGTVSNAAAVAAYVRPYAESTGRDVVLISAGKYPDEAQISDEDDAACAYLAARLGLPLAAESQAEFTRWDEAIRREGLESIFRAARHAKRLEICSAVMRMCYFALAPIPFPCSRAWWRR